MFNLVKNVSSMQQGFYLRPGDLLTVPQNGVIDTHLLRWSDRPGFIKIQSFINEVDASGTGKFYVQRTFSLGDVLMLVPAVRAFQQLGYTVFFRTSQEYFQVLLRLGITPYTLRSDPVFPCMVFDWMIEQDHVNPEMSKYHRTHLYLKALGWPEPLPDIVDWSCDLSKFPELPFDVPKDFIVFQGQGANIRKQLRPEAIEGIIRKLTQQGIVVYYIGKGAPTHLAGDLLKIPDLTIEHLFTLLAQASVLLCMDSGPLWVSHFTNTPVIGIFGPTHWKQRLSLHPLYPDGVTAVQLNSLIDCPTCYEHAVRCKDKFTCLNQQADGIVNAVYNALEVFLNVGD